ncbi:MAG TPA: hypothetical protein VFX86_04160 [Candidatus Saccharimonadales bacterium]|nr:hypothetical protein [Candidatus Saccharimonadales bacterium]
MLREILTRYRKQLVLLSVGLIAVFLAIWLWNYLRYGTISVTTTENNKITITELDEETGKERDLFKKSAAGALTVRVSPGRYMVSVSGKVNAINKVAVVKPRQTIKYNLNPPGLKTYESVVGQAAKDMAINDGVLSFLDSQTGAVTRVNSSNRLSYPAASGFIELDWADPDFGVGINNTRDLYLIKGGSLSKLALPEAKPKAGAISFSVSPDRTVFVSIAKNIYVYSSGRFNKIYTASAPVSAISAANNAVALINPPPSDEAVAESPSGITPSIELIDKTGRPLVKKNIYGNKGVWSPDGKRLAVINHYGENGLGSSEIYDTSLNLVKTLPNTGIGSVDWLDGDTLAYNTGNALWTYDMEDEQSQIIVSLTPQNIILSVAIERKSGQLYFSHSKPDNKYVLERTALSEKPVDEELVALSVFLPVNLDSCLIDYVNFKKPPAIAMYTSAKNRSICKTQAEIELTQDRIDYKKFKYQPYILREGE